MPNQSGKIVLVLILLLLIAGAGVYFFLPGFKKESIIEQVPNPSITAKYPNSQEAGESSGLSKKYSSEDLKISFEYPTGWIIDDRYKEVLLANFTTSLNSNKVPKSNEVEIIIHSPGGCHATIEENLKDPSCGELGPNVKSYEILSKEIEDINGAKFYKYLVKNPEGKQQNFYFLEKGDRILQIDKKPDPSMFEKEFKEIIKSIRFN